jgi:hypothetical protein
MTLAALLVLRPWPDPLLDRVGHDPRADYVEQFWLPILGPSALLLLRRLVSALDAQVPGPSGVTSAPGPGGDAEPRTVSVGDLASSLGMGSPRGPSGAFYRTLDRLVSFGFAHLVDDATLAVRTHLPPLTRRQLKRLPEVVRAEHDRWLADQAQAPGVATEHMTRRARALALSLLELGEDRVGAERQLHHWQFHPAIAHEAIRWATAEHERRRPPPPEPA